MGLALVVPAILLVLGAAVPSCDHSGDSGRPVGPEPEPEPEGIGTLEVTVTVDGARPDADGYSVVVVLASQDQQAEHVESAGGAVRFPDLRLGSHAVRLEGLAPNCSVNGANPRPFRIAPNATARVDFLIRCPGPGILLVRTESRGVDLDLDGYTLALQGSFVREEPIGVNDSLSISAEELSPRGLWAIRLKDVEDHCRVESDVLPRNARVTSDPLQVRLADGVTVRVTFTNTCFQRSSRIAFHGYEPGGDTDIYIITAAAGAQAVNLTHHPADDMGPALSPDRTRVVFSSSRDDPESDSGTWTSTELYSIRADGTGEVRLTHSPGGDWVGPQAWSPDGSRIAFRSTRDDPNGEIYIMSADGSGVVRLTKDGVSAGCNPAWSPDGAWIAFCREGGIYRMSPFLGSAALRVTSDGHDPSWSPDGSRIAFSRGYFWDWPLSNLAVIGADGSGFIQLHPNLVNSDVYFGPSWSPDGSWIAVTRRSFTLDVVIFPFTGDGFGEGLRLVSGSAPSWR